MIGDREVFIGCLIIAAFLLIEFWSYVWGLLCEIIR